MLFTLPFVGLAQNGNKKEINILFIGNSLTYYNDMPAVLQKMFDLSHLNFKITQSAFAGMSLQGHLNDIITEKTDSMISTRPKIKGDTTETEKLLHLNQWNYIVLQEGTIRLLIPEVRNFIVIPAIEAIKKIAPKNAEFIFFKTWPDTASYPKQFCYPGNVIDKSITKQKCCSQTFTSLNDEVKCINMGYDSVSLATKIKNLPVTNCFAEIIKDYPEINLYEDDSHPSKLGAYLNACIFYKYFSKQKAITINYFGDIDKKTALMIQKVVDKNY